MKAADFQRKKLNLVVVLDVSGSMDPHLINIITTGLATSSSLN